MADLPNLLLTQLVCRPLRGNVGVVQNLVGQIVSDPGKNALVEKDSFDGSFPRTDQLRKFRPNYSQIMVSSDPL